MDTDSDEDLFKLPPAKEPKKQKKKSSKKKKVLEVLADEGEAVDIFADDVDIFGPSSAHAFSLSSKESDPFSDVLLPKDEPDDFGFDVKDIPVQVDSNKNNNMSDDDDGDDFFSMSTDDNVSETRPLVFDFNAMGNDDLFGDVKLTSGLTVDDSDEELKSEQLASGKKTENPEALDLFSDFTPQESTDGLDQRSAQDISDSSSADTNANIVDANETEALTETWSNADDKMPIEAGKERADEQRLNNNPPFDCGKNEDTGEDSFDTSHEHCTEESEGARDSDMDEGEVKELKGQRPKLDSDVLDGSVEEGKSEDRPDALVDNPKENNLTEHPVVNPDFQKDSFVDDKSSNIQEFHPDEEKNHSTYEHSSSPDDDRLGNPADHTDSQMDETDTLLTKTLCKSTESKNVNDPEERHSDQDQNVDVLISDVECVRDKSHTPDTAGGSLSALDTVEETENDCKAETEMVKCCKCDLLSLPVGEMVKKKILELSGRNIALEELVTILEKESLQQREQITTERRKAAVLDESKFELKARLTEEQRISEEYQAKCEQLEESLIGTRKMVTVLEEQLTSANTYRSGVDYMLESQLAQGRVAAAEGRVQDAQNELLQAQEEIKRLLDKLNAVNQEKREMVSLDVHQELMKISDDKSKDTEFALIQLKTENSLLRHEVDELKEQLKEKHPSLSQALGNSTGDWTDAFQTQTMTGATESISFSTMFSDNYMTSMDKIFGSALSDKVLQPTPFVIAQEALSAHSTGHDKKQSAGDDSSSDWSSDSDTDNVPVKPPTSDHEKTGAEVILQARAALHKVPTQKPPVAQKPKLPPKPGLPPKPVKPAKPQRKLQPTASSLVTEEKPVSFDEAAGLPSLKTVRKPRGPQGRRKPSAAT